MTATTWLRIESAAIALASGVLFVFSDASLWWGAAWLAPDLAAAGYLAGPRVGAACYNAVHTYAAPVSLGALGLATAAPLATALAWLWANHIAVDRALGYGLKRTTGFNDTHLCRIGRG